MSTESETKSAGVPAGATHVCTDCGAYWGTTHNGWIRDSAGRDDCPCPNKVPIAEAGPAPTTAETPALPQARACIHGAWNCQACLWANGRPVGELTAHYLAAPTTAAPAEQLSGKVVCGSNAHLVVEADEPHYETQTCVKPRPAEQPACVNPYHLKSGNHDGKTCYSIRTTPAEQPGKADEGDHADDCTDPNCPKRHTIPAGNAADPRKHSTVKCACGRFDVGIATVQPAWNVEGSTSVRHTQEACGRYGAGVVLPQATDPSPAKPPIVVCATWPQTLHAEDSHPCSDPRPAQPQAPAEPSKEQFDKAGRVLAAVMDAERRGENMDPIVARALAAEAAPLREERDRLARDRDVQAGRAKALERRLIAQTTTDPHWQRWKRTEAERGAERAKVAGRDARIVTLTKALEEIRAWAHPGGTFGKIAAAALGAPEGQPRDYDPMTSPVPEGDMNGPHGPIPAPEGQPPVASSEAPPDALRRLAAKWDQEASEAADVNRLATLRLCARELRAALSAPPPPTREKQELLGKEGAKPDGLLRAMAYARDELDGCAHGDGCCRDCLARILASMDETISLARSAPPRKAPQEGCKACALVAKEFGTVNPEGQTPQEPKAEWHVVGEADETCVDIATGDGDVVAEVYGSAAHLKTAYQRAVAICAAHNGRALASTPSPAKQTEQKIASAEGTASQLGAAPELHEEQGVSSRAQDDAIDRWRADEAAPAQPDARDAEIARLRRQIADIADMEQERGEVNQALKDEMQSAARLTKELEEARAALTEADEGENVALRARNAAEAQAKALREALKTAQYWAPIAVDNALGEVHRQGQFDRRLMHEARIAAEGSLRIIAALPGKYEPRVYADDLAPPEPKAETPAETPPMVWCEKHECPREVCGNYQHPPPAETAGQKEGP